MPKQREIPRELYPTDLLMIGPWASALKAVMVHKSIFARYQKETNDTFKPNVLPVDILTSGSDKDEDFEFLLRFIKWFNKAIWGKLDTKAGE